MAEVQDSGLSLKAAFQNSEGADGDKKFSEEKSEGDDGGGTTLPEKNSVGAGGDKALPVFEENDDDEINPLNALRVDTVIERVFTFLRVKDLAQCRAVCKQWKDIGMPILIDRIEQVQIKQRLCSEHGTSDIDSFLKMQLKNTFYFTNFYFEEVPMTAPKTLELFDLCGTEMTKLKLYLKADNLLTASGLTDILTHKAPFLESLELDRIPEKITRDYLFDSAKDTPEWEIRSLTLTQACRHVKYSSTFLKDFFRAAGKLNSLSLIHFHEEDQVKVLKAFSKYGRLKNLRELNLSTLSKKTLCFLIDNYKLAPIEKFSAEKCRKGDLNRDFLGTFVSQHQATLETLAFDFETTRQARMTLPILKKLTYLSIGCWDATWRPTVSFGLWDYGKQFPNLVTLKLIDPGVYSNGESLFNLDEIFPQNGTPSLSLRNLELHPALTPAVLKRIGACFPKLQKLWLMPQPGEVLAQLWGTWTTIKTLGIELRGNNEEDKKVDPGAPKQNLDSIFTGIQPAALEALDATALSEMSDMEVDSIRTLPSINTWADLHHLIVYDALCLRPTGTEFVFPYLELSDTTAVSTLSKMRSIVFLHLGTGTHKISSECKATMCSKMGLEETEDHIDDKIELVRYDWQKHQPFCPVGFCMSLPDYS